MTHSIQTPLKTALMGTLGGLALSVLAVPALAATTVAPAVTAAIELPASKPLQKLAQSSGDYSRGDRSRGDRTRDRNRGDRSRDRSRNHDHVDRRLDRRVERRRDRARVERRIDRRVDRRVNRIVNDRHISRIHTPRYRDNYRSNLGISFSFGNNGYSPYRWGVSDHGFYRPGRVSFASYVNQTRCQRIIVDGWHYGRLTPISVKQCYNPFDGTYIIQGSERLAYRH